MFSETTKTPITVLQEMMMKLNETPQYECTAQSGPQHQAMFVYSCTTQGLSVTAHARSKKEAKQEAARAMLQKLAARGVAVAPPYNTNAAPSTSQFQSTSNVTLPSSTAPRSYVALLRELCEEYHMPALTDDLVSDTGPAHARHFTVTARVGSHARSATSTTKKAARQLAAEQLYNYLKENLARVTKDFVEEDALVRARAKAMDRFVEARDEAAAWRPDLGQRVADYHRGLVTHIDKKKRDEGVEALEGLRTVDSIHSLDTVASLLGLRVEWDELPTNSGEALYVLQLVPTAPALAWAAGDKHDAALQALDYLRHGLAQDNDDDVMMS